jgi:lipoic acid synthetase
MGDVCTRNCRYCAIRSGAPGPADPTEPERVARAIAELGLRYAVITSVTRDDIPDGGAALFAATVRAIRGISPHCRVEVLIPDFGQSMETSIERVMEAGPDVINHNIETVGSLFPSLRPRGDYSLSLRLLARVASSGRPAKSGLMLGLGESMDQVRATLEDLLRAGCSILTAGQYLRSRRENHPVERFYTPEEFERVRELAESMGFGRVLAGPMVRSSYHAGEL